MSHNNSTLAFRNAILESAVQHGISGDGLEYYEFLINKATSELEEGEELEEDALAEIVSKVKKQSKGSANSSVKSGKEGAGTPPPSDGNSSKVTLEKFCSMSITEKSKLYTKSPDLYTELMTEAKAKKKLV